MQTDRQALGKRGESAVCTHAMCPRCNRARHFKRLPTNFECADIICKFCGLLGQVKTTRLKDGTDEFPDRIMSAAWRPQHDRIIAGVYHGLYLVGYRQNAKTLVRIDFVPPHILEATPGVFEPRKPLSATAKRAGWAGYTLVVSELPKVGRRRIYPSV
jgi:transcription elongation factor Elf1